MMSFRLVPLRWFFQFGLVASLLFVSACGGGVYVAPRGSTGTSPGGSVSAKASPPSGSAPATSTPAPGSTPTPVSTLAPGTTPSPAGTATPIVQATATPPSTVTPLYLVGGAAAVESRDPTSGALLTTISGSMTQLQQATDVATDNAGNVYVLDNAAYAIYEYPKGANGNVAPIRTIALFGGPTQSAPANGASLPTSLAIDTANNIYALTLDGNASEVFEYDPGSSTANSAYGFEVPGRSNYIRLDGSGDIYVATTNTINEYSPGMPQSFVNNPTKRTITDADVTGETAINGLDVDQQGDIVVSVGQAGEVDYFTAAQSGTVSPAKTYSGNFSYAEGVAFNAASDIFVGSDASATGTAANNMVTVIESAPGVPRRTFPIDTAVQNLAF